MTSRKNKPPRPSEKEASALYKGLRNVCRQAGMSVRNLLGVERHTKLLFDNCPHNLRGNQKKKGR